MKKKTFFFLSKSKCSISFLFLAFCFGGGGNMEFIYIVKQFVEKEKEIAILLD